MLIRTGGEIIYLKKSNRKWPHPPLHWTELVKKMQTPSMYIGQRSTYYRVLKESIVIHSQDDQPVIYCRVKVKNNGEALTGWSLC